MIITYCMIAGSYDWVALTCNWWYIIHIDAYVFNVSLHWADKYGSDCRGTICRCLRWNDRFAFIFVTFKSRRSSYRGLFLYENNKVIRPRVSGRCTSQIDRTFHWHCHINALSTGALVNRWVLSGNAPASRRSTLGCVTRKQWFPTTNLCGVRNSGRCCFVVVDIKCYGCI